MNIREATINDVPAMLHIYNNVVRTSSVTFDLIEQTLEERIIWFHQFNESFPLLVAVEEAEVIGYACLTPFRDKPAYSRTVENSIYLSKSARGKGVGSVLLADLIKRAKVLDYHTVIAVLADDDPASRSLHRKFGFQKTGSVKEVGFKFNEWHDIHFYQLILGNFKKEEVL
ncbi:GNAT family N-acetyltransferase [Alkalihalobacillus sp. AL-G]|uniref:GNAT family N-acetyltransferase n=1 Tax=Alkalihalobacillus sp. AL-G TaxID=2926399 RepID=UPI002729E029|nr:GNAT family N-acetyltransferase [Alkalihalobacillus sp. AL-G]WLD94027.1 N-acetyltransferase family protein [Alkalihalobacillus sp. AL-G]